MNLTPLTNSVLERSCFLIFQSKVNIEDGKFVELHRDKDDPGLDARMTREVIGNQLVVVRI